jgi:hypothetical protein
MWDKYETKVFFLIAATAVLVAFLFGGPAKELTAIDPKPFFTPVNMNGYKIQSLGAATADTDAVTRGVQRDSSTQNTGTLSDARLSANVTLLGSSIGLTDEVTGTLPITNGGTARTSFTAYSLLAGGTTSTGSLQSLVDVGTVGQVLTSNGAGALPSWSTNSNPDVQRVTFSSYWSRPTGRKITVAFVVGAGGGGGSGRRGAASTASYGGGGGAPGASVWGWFPTDLLPSSVYATVGIAGGGGTAVSTDSTNGNTGANGGYSEFFTLRAVGGNGGVGGTASAGAGGAAQSNAGGSQSYPFTSNAGGNGTVTGTNQPSVNLITTSLGAGPTAGGAGGGISTGNVAAAGSASGAFTGTVPQFSDYATGGAGNGSNGTDGGTSGDHMLFGGVGGGGGGGSTSSSAGNGGNGIYGGGGGGGGASRNGFNSGTGGNGGGGFVVIISF